MELLKLLAAVASVTSASAQFCDGSPRQMCKMLCRPPRCPAGQCAMRSGSCCDVKCQPMDVSVDPGFSMPVGLPHGARCTTSRTRGNRGNPQKCAAGLMCKITDPGDMRYDKPNSGTCQTAAFRPTDPVLPRPGSGDVIPAGCTRWHDGCNNCAVRNGRKIGCTEMACFRNDGARCLSYGGNVGPSTGDAIIACSPGQRSMGFGRCADCPVGTYSNGQSRTCVPCSVGTYNPLAGQSSCSRCPPGKVAPTPGMAMCLHKGGVAGEGERCAAGFCEDPSNCPKCAKGLTCTTQPGMMCAGTCFGTCEDGH